MNKNHRSGMKNTLVIGVTNMKKIITIIITVVISGNSWGVGLGNLEGIVEDIKQNR